MSASGQDRGPDDNDPQRLLADLAAEYNRSRRFLEQLENNFVKDAPPAPPSGSPYVPFDNDVPPTQSTAPSDSSANPAENQQQPQSAHSNLRSKLRSFFSRRTIAREDVSEPTVRRTLARTSSESQSTMASRCLTPSTTMASERQFPTPYSARRTSQVYYAASPADIPRAAPHAAAAAIDGTRPTTGRRSSIVYFSGDAMDSTSQGWVARVVGVGGSDAGDRPATSRRPSIVYCGGTGATGPQDIVAATAAAADAAATAAAAVGSAEQQHVRTSTASCGSGDLERLSQRYGDDGGGTCPAHSTSGLGYSVQFAGGPLQGITDPYEFMSVIAGSRRSTSFQQRSGTKLLPTAQRLRSAATTRRTSIESYSSHELVHHPPPPLPQHQYQKQLGVRASLEARQVLFGTAPHVHVVPEHSPMAPTVSRRAGSLEIPRPFSAAPRHHPSPAAAAATVSPERVSTVGRRAGSLEISRPFSAATRHYHPTATATATAAAANISNSALFTPATLSGYTHSVTALPAASAAAGGCSGGRIDVPPSPPPPAVAQGQGACARQLQHQGGFAWVAPAVASPVSTAGAAPPSDAAAFAAAVLEAGLGRGAGVGGSGSVASGPVFRTSLNLSSRRLVDYSAPSLAVTTAAAAAWAAAMHSMNPGEGIEELCGTSCDGMAGTAAVAAAAAPPPPPAVACGAAALHVRFAVDDTDEAAASAAGIAAPASAVAAVAASAPLPPPSPSTSPIGGSPSPSLDLHPSCRIPVRPHTPQPLLQPHPPPQPSTQTPQTIAVLRLRGFGGSIAADAVVGDGGNGGCGSSITATAVVGDHLSTAGSRLGCAARIGEHAGSASQCERTVQFNL